MSPSLKLTSFTLVLIALAPSAGAQPLAPPPAGAHPVYSPSGDGASAVSSYDPYEDQASGDQTYVAPRVAHRRRHGEARACYAQVRYPARYGPPPTGPEYIWRQAPAPPGAPGPVWCLTVQPFPDTPVLVAPARLGWIRVLCADDATPDRVSHLQRRLRQRGLYRGEIDGRYDEETAVAVASFQAESHIEHRGYLSYETMDALDAPTAPPVYWRPHTTFERGFVSWPGKSRYW